MSEPIKLPTRGGSLELVEGAGECTGCKTKGGGLLEVTVRGALDPSIGGTVAICGNCVAEALAIMLGRRHVQAGGKVEDLTAQPPSE